MASESLLSPAPVPPIAPLLLTCREAARLLAVCEKTLWNLTRRGELPAVRIGGAKRYSLADLQAFIHTKKGARP
jgi:excisionase family DNA binding protein